MTTHTAPPLSSTKDLTPIEIAKRVANAASFLDCVKSRLALADDKAGAAFHVDQLHALAMLIAGDQVHEVYAPEDEEVAA